MKQFYALFIFFYLYCIPTAIAIEEIDSVIAIVDQSVVLQSEIDNVIERVKQAAIESEQQLPSDQALTAQAIERLILTELQLQVAGRMGLQISDIQLDQTLNSMAEKQNMNIEQFRLSLIQVGEDYEKFRESVREEITISETRRANVHRRIYISLQEIDNLLKLLEESGISNEEYHLGHILIAIPNEASSEEIQSSKERANKVMELLNSGSDFSKLARGASSGAKALEGGDLGWMNINEMPTLFSEAIRDEAADQIIGPIRSGAGFHILKLIDIRGRQVVEVKEAKARHILVKPSIILSESKTKQMLVEFKKQILAKEKTFAELAKEYSEDPGSALKEGVLDWANPEIYVPSFKQRVQEQEIGEISDPFRSSHGWHIVEVLERRTLDGTKEAKRDRAYGLLYNRKFNEEAENWLREIRDQAYIEIFSE